MQATTTYSSFPDQVVPAAEKATYEYGLQVARAIEGEWFRNSTEELVIDLILIIIIFTI